jgi:hypothetical protein
VSSILSLVSSPRRGPCHQSNKGAIGYFYQVWDFKRRTLKPIPVVGSALRKIASHRGRGMQLFLLHSFPASDLIVEVLGYADAMALFVLYSNET